MRLRPLYRVRFAYPAGWSIALAGPPGAGSAGAAGAGTGGSRGSAATGVGAESQDFYLAEGRREGAIAGRFRGTNHPRRRADGTYQPDFQGVIETDDGAVVFFQMKLLLGAGQARCQRT